ncbi:hypothetical protein [Mycoplasma sp. VS410B]|uniref:hypothetical protein n=1 Tax=Mycoplasma sp. VS410B TaxID=3401688 RepID=UPI003AAFDB4B
MTPNLIKEKNLENRIKKILKDNNINYFKLFANGIQGAGLADLWVFNNFYAYAIEIKRDFKVNKPTMLQLAKAQEFRNNVIYLFVDQNNYKEVIKLIITNKNEELKQISNQQLEQFIND